MNATKGMETVFSTRDFPAAFIRLGSGLQERDQADAVSTVSGLRTERHPDGAIFGLMLRRNLLVAAHDGVVAQSAWRVR